MLKEKINWLKVILISFIELLFLAVFATLFPLFVFLICGEGSDSFLYSPYMDISGYVLSIVLVSLVNTFLFSSAERTKNFSKAKVIVLVEIIDLVLFALFTSCMYVANGHKL